jgi:hypothetical protein
MELPALKDQNVYPSDKVLEETLANSFPAYLELRSRCSKELPGLSFEWRYYKDGNAWLCKAVYKKKTVFWLSVWDAFFKTTFYFTEKTGSGIAELEINEEMKKIFHESRPVGKLYPLTIPVKEPFPIGDLLKIIAYKLKQK